MINKKTDNKRWMFHGFRTDIKSPNDGKNWFSFYKITNRVAKSWKLSRNFGNLPGFFFKHSGIFFGNIPGFLETFRDIFGNLPGILETFRDFFGNILGFLETFRDFFGNIPGFFWKFTGIFGNIPGFFCKHSGIFL